MGSTSIGNEYDEHIEEKEGVMTNHDAVVLLENLYDRMKDGDIKTKVTDLEREALYKALAHTRNVEKIERRSK
jgi:hypothetical protein